MNLVLPQREVDAQVAGIIKLAVMAVGGQGGGVLTSWIESMARAQGYACQATSVAGVAQRTGATVYYVEMAPDTGGTPVFSLAPAGGDVDILIAAEMMEAGRAIQRGFVTPDRTTLIASTHRALAVSEKSVPGDGIALSDEVMAAAEIAAQQLIAQDMEALALSNGSVISASLFGALAGSGALPFPREAYEEAITKSGKGVAASLRAFSAGFDAAQGVVAPVVDVPVTRLQVSGPGSEQRTWGALQTRIAALPAPVVAMAQAGLRKVVDFQDCDYGAAYLDHVDAVLAHDRDDFILGAEAAKHIANAMAYDDVIKVADLKTRAARFDRIRAEMQVGDDHLLQLTEFMHPRAEEIAGLLPAGIGRRIEASERWMRLITRLFSRGRRMRTHSIRAFGMLHVLGGMRRYRLRTLRHSYEVAHLELWLERVHAVAPKDYALAVEILRNRRLIKGYSDTHVRGLTKFDKVMDGAALLEGRHDAAEWTARLREAALKDEKGEALDGALQTIKSFV